MPNVYYEDVADFVQDQARDVWNRSGQALNEAQSAIDRMASVDPPVEGAPPEYTLPLPDTIVVPAPASPDSAKFGDVNDINMPVLESPNNILAGIDLNVDIPEFNPTIVDLVIPDAPAAIDTSGMPSRPDLAVVDVPTEPALPMPELENLEPITVPEFVFPSLPTFDAVAPEFTEAAPSTLLNWSEPVYNSDVLDDIKATVSMMLAGGTGLPAAVEQALFDRARSREDITALKSVQEAFDAFAGRGFSMPPGMLVEQVNAANQQNQLQVNALSREILIKSAEWEIENLRQAVQQGIALEGQLINMFLNMAQRSFDAARFRVEADIQLYQAAVSLFNARMGAYQTAAQVFETRLRGELAKLDVFRAQIEGQQAIASLNEQRVRVYVAQYEGVRNAVEIFKARMQGAEIRAGLNRERLEAYKTDIQAYAEKLNAQKVQFDAYEARVRGESSKASLVEAQARAFAATIQGVEAQTNIKAAAIRARVDGLQASIAKFTALLEGERTRINAQATAIQSQSQAYQAEVSRYAAELQVNTAQAEIQVRQTEAQVRNNLGAYEVRMRAYDAAMTRLIEKFRIQAEAIKGAAAANSQLAAGAMSALNTSASLTGHAGVSSSDSYNVSVTREE